MNDANLLEGGVSDPNVYCCGCGEKADLTGQPYQCFEMTPQGMCSHLVCQQCYCSHEEQGQGTMERCDCHVSFDNGQSGFGMGNGPAVNPQGSGGPLDKILKKMVSNESKKF